MSKQMDDAEYSAERAAERAAEAKREADEAIAKAENLRLIREETRANKAKLEAGRDDFRLAVEVARESGIYFTLRELRDIVFDLSRVHVESVEMRPDAEEVGIVRKEATKTGTEVFRHYRILPNGSTVRNGLPALGGEKREAKSAVFDD